MLPSVDVACPNGQCRAHGVAYRVALRRVAATVLEVPRLICAACGAEPETVRPYGPEGEQTMPHITRLGGPSNAADQPATVPVLVGEPGPELDMPAATEGGAPSPGSSSPASSEKPQTKPESTGKPRQSRARTTGSRSARARTGSSSAPGTAGDQTDPASATAD